MCFYLLKNIIFNTQHKHVEIISELNKQRILIKINTGSEKTLIPISILLHISPLTLRKLFNLSLSGDNSYLSHGSDEICRL